MSKEVLAVYQDCVFCGDKGRKKAKEFASKGVLIRKVGFTTPEGKELIRQAVLEHKIGSMPFFTDGEIFTTNLDDFIEKPAKKTKKTKKTTKESE
jgi:hypothetical protein